MTKLQAIKKSIAHWKEIIKWAERQPQNATPASGLMKVKINQSWFADDCALCEVYRAENCRNCPLAKKYGNCTGDYETKNQWIKVFNSQTWSEWLIHARKLLEQLESLLPKRKKK